MAKIIQGDLPQKINVVSNGKIIAAADFGEDGVYVTDNETVIEELRKYGYEVKEGKKAKKEELD